MNKLITTALMAAITLQFNTISFAQNQNLKNVSFTDSSSSKIVKATDNRSAPKAKVATQESQEEQEEAIDKAELEFENEISYGDVIVPEDAILPEATEPKQADSQKVQNINQGNTTLNIANYAKQVNEATWSPKMKVNSAMTVKMQVLLDWNHASPGPIDGGWGMNSKKALSNFQKIAGLPVTGLMNQATWEALTKNIPTDQPALMAYTLTKEDMQTKIAKLPAGAEARSKIKGLYYESIEEMLAEKFHMDIRYFKKLNQNKKFVEGESITVINPAKPFKTEITRVVANRAEKILYAYNGNKLVATYPTTIGGSASSTPGGTYKIINKVKMPYYKATVNRNTDNKKTYILPPGPNSPVGVVWMGLNKPSYGIHGSPVPEGISRQSSLGCIRLVNWDVLELHANIKNGATVEIK